MSHRLVSRDYRVVGDYRPSHTPERHDDVRQRGFERGYYAALWSEVERPLLASILGQLGGRSRACLDFACGTGRVAGLAARSFGVVVGVDISESMLAHVRTFPDVSAERIDIANEYLGMKFDVVTAFGFFLNAEDDLRREAARAIWLRLNDHGRLVCNIHMNSESLAGKVYAAIREISGRTLHKTMSAARFALLLEECGFVVEEIVPYGWMPRPGSLFPRACERLVGPVDRMSAKLGLPGRCAQNFIVVARKSGAPTSIEGEPA